MKRIICIVLSFALMIPLSAPCFAANISNNKIDAFIQQIVEQKIGKLENYNKISATEQEYQIVYSSNIIAHITEETTLNGDTIITIREGSLTNKIIHKYDGELLWADSSNQICQGTIMRRGGSIYYSETPFYGRASDYTEYDGSTTRYYRFGMLIQFVTFTVFSGVVAAVSPGLGALLSGVQIADAIADVYDDAQSSSSVAEQDVIYSEVETWGLEDPPNFAQTGIMYTELNETFYGDDDEQLGDTITYYQKLVVRMID